MTLLVSPLLPFFREPCLAKKGLTVNKHEEQKAFHFSFKHDMMVAQSSEMYIYHFLTLLFFACQD